MNSLQILVILVLIYESLSAVERKNKDMMMCYWTSCQDKNTGKKCANGYQQKAMRKCSLKNSKTNVDNKQSGLYRKCCKYSDNNKI
jgi:Tfp pilus assembly protein FimT